MKKVMIVIVLCLITISCNNPSQKNNDQVENTEPLNHGIVYVSGTNDGLAKYYYDKNTITLNSNYPNNVRYVAIVKYTGNNTKQERIKEIRSYEQLDCANMRSSLISAEIDYYSGNTLTSHAPILEWENEIPGTSGYSVAKAVCKSAGM